jgi:hypothetical protein
MNIKLNNNNYLTNIPEIANNHGFCKTLIVRREIIHIKHIFKELFVKKTIDIQFYLDTLELSLFDYMEIMTNRIRRVHNFSREFYNDCNKIVKHHNNGFFPTFEFLNGLKRVIALDFDGVLTQNKFKDLYLLCCERGKVQICSANPTIEKDWFLDRNLPLPEKINSMKGAVKKIKQLIEIQKKFDYVFFVDNEIKYLEFAWIFGLKTYHWTGKEIKYFSMNADC